jgi:hypothetical protein
MCQATRTPPALACTIADLVPGDFYHNSDGDTFIILALTRTADSTMVVNARTGQVTPVYSDVKLGYDERGRLYSSRALNGWEFELPTVLPDDGSGAA